MRKVGLYITTLLYDVSRAGYQVSFNRDMIGMVRVDFRKDHVAEFYEHEHCGFPGCPREKLEKDIIEALVRFKNTYDVPTTAFLEGT